MNIYTLCLDYILYIMDTITITTTTQHTYIYIQTYKHSYRFKINSQNKMKSANNGTRVFSLFIW